MTSTAQPRRDYEPPVAQPRGSGAEPPPLPQGPGLDPEKLDGLVLDDARAKLTGIWGHSDGLRPHVADGYRYGHADGQHAATFTIRVKNTGDYDLRYYWMPHENRTKSAEIAITDSKGTKTATLDFTEPPANDGEQPWRSLGTFHFVDVLDGQVRVTGTAGGYLHVDCVQLVPVK